MPLSQLIVLFCGYSLGGWLISANSVSLGVWLIVEAVTLYLAWSGTGAIALATAGVTGIVWIETLSITCPSGMVWVGIPLTAVQVWAGTLALSWLLAMVLVCKLAFTNQRLNHAGFSKAQTFWLLVLITNLGLKAGQLSESKLQ